MAFKQVSTDAIAINKPEMIDKPILGTYVGKKEITNQFGPQVIWQFEGEEDGHVFGIFGFTNLDRAMETVKLNSYLRITYKGTANKKTKFGWKNVHQVLVEADDGDENDAQETPAIASTRQPAMAGIGAQKKMPFHGGVPGQFLDGSPVPEEE